MNLLLYAVPVLLTGSALLFLSAVVFQRRTRQWSGTVLAVFALALFALYYSDRPPLEDHPLRNAVKPLATLVHADATFRSSTVPVAALSGLYLVRIVAYLRLAVRRRRREITEGLRDVNDRVGNFFAFTAVAILLDGIITSAFSLGWVGSLSIGLGFALLYIGMVGIFADALTLATASAKLSGVWGVRRLLAIATLITRSAVWVADLYRKIRPNLRSLIDRVRAATGRQMEGLHKDEDVGDEKLVKTGHRNVPPVP